MPKGEEPKEGTGKMETMTFEHPGASSQVSGKSHVVRSSRQIMECFALCHSAPTDYSRRPRFRNRCGLESANAQQ